MCQALGRRDHKARKAREDKADQSAQLVAAARLGLPDLAGKQV